MRSKNRFSYAWDEIAKVDDPYIYKGMDPPSKIQMHKNKRMFLKCQRKPLEAQKMVKFYDHWASLQDWNAQQQEDVSQMWEKSFGSPKNGKILWQS